MPIEVFVFLQAQRFGCTYIPDRPFRQSIRHSSALMRLRPFTNFFRTIYLLSLVPRTGPSTRPAGRLSTLKSMSPLPFLGSLFSSSSSTKMSVPDQRSEEEWRAVLNKEQFRVIREKGTEAPFQGKYDKHYPSEGVYACAACGAPLYKAGHKFKSGCGWPAYFDSIPGAVTRHEDRTLGMSRTEITCANCGGHLGHVFKGEGYATPTDERHCVNSVSLSFSPNDKPVEKKEDASRAST